MYSLTDDGAFAESVIDGVLHPELRDRMILLRGIKINLSLQ